MLSGQLTFAQQDCHDCSSEWADRAYWNRNKEIQPLAHDITDFNFSNIYVTGEEPMDEGVWGNAYQRVVFFVFHTERDKQNESIYHLTGKLKHQGRYLDFSGSFTITDVYYYGEQIELGDEVSLPTIDFVADYTIQTFDNGTLNGMFKGKLVTRVTLNPASKDYVFNEIGAFNHYYKFVGVWKPINGEPTQKCIWSSNDKLPYTTDFDMGDKNERVINKKYLDNGWRNSSPVEKWHLQFKWD